jgi:hypothetical protein
MLGRYWETWHEGIHFLLPGLMRLKSKIVIGQSHLVKILVGGTVDFKDGSVGVKNGIAVVRVYNGDVPYDAGDGIQRTGVWRASYLAPDDIKGAIAVEVGNAIRSYLNGLDLDEGISNRAAGFDLWTKLPVGERTRVEAILKLWGYEIISVVNEDFELSSRVQAARESIHEREKLAIAAKEDQKIRTRQTVGYVLDGLALARGKSKREIQKEIDENPELRKLWEQWLFELAYDRVAIEGKALQKIILEGGGDLENALGRLIALFKS